MQEEIEIEYITAEVTVNAGSSYLTDFLGIRSLLKRYIHIVFKLDGILPAI